MRSSALSISGDGAGAQAEAMLAKQSYCEPLQDAAMKEVGIDRDARQVWVVMAAPFAPSVELSEQAAGQRVLELVNQARATPRYCGDRAFNAARPVRWNDALAEAARGMPRTWRATITSATAAATVPTRRNVSSARATDIVQPAKTSLPGK